VCYRGLREQAGGETASIVVTGVNDAPSSAGAVLAPISNDVTDPPGATISGLLAGRFSDVDNGAALSGVAVVGNGSSAGTTGEWEYSSDGGATWFAVGNVGDDSSALALSAAVGANPAATAQALKRCRGLPHRMQSVGEFASAVWIDDSKATNVGAALMSIASVPDPFVLIAGGDAKGASFGELADALRGRDCEAVLIGRDAAAIERELRHVCEVHLVEDMTTAVRIARQLVPSGGTVLLAPACSSLDMFENFSARGDAFAAAVRELET